MYEVDGNDKVISLDPVPQSSVGAPTPLVLGDERTVVLAFFLQDTPDGWDGSSVRVIDKDSDEPVAIVRFKGHYAQMFGPPNDEAFSGHPFYGRGLEPYGAYEVINSSCIRQLERMNSVHPYHKTEQFRDKRHYVFSFHDSTFECVADDFDITLTRGSMGSILPIMKDKLWSR